MNIYRQGDLGITPIEKLPKQKYKKTEVDENGFILAYGESTGHKHLLVMEKPSVKIEVLEDTLGQHYLNIENGNALIRHEQHKTIKIETGFYLVKHEQEYDYFNEKNREVTD